MKPSITFAITLLSATAAITGAWSLRAHAAPLAQPIVVELFTSQGCSSCPPTDKTVAKLADRADVLALSFGVTYWNSLGWTDTFAKPEFTQRQRDYATTLRSHSVYTPQVVVDGRGDTVGSTVGQIEPLIRAARDIRPVGPAITAHGNRIAIGSGAKPNGNTTVWLVHYDPRTVLVPIRRGENGGRTLPLRNVVRDLVPLGAWTGAAKEIAVKPPADVQLRTAILIQAGRGGAIIGSAKL